MLGGQDIDTRFVEAPLNRNIPVLMALLGIWYRDDRVSRRIIPYDERMARFPAYLQQLGMESNGMSVDLSGKRQMLHQGTTIVPIDFLVAAQPLAADIAHHHLLSANCFAQSQALMQGRSIEEVILGKN